MLFVCSFRAYSDIIHYSGGGSELQVQDGKMISENSWRRRFRNLTIPRDGDDYEIESIVNDLPFAYFI